MKNINTNIDLREIQLIELEILKKIKEVCDKNNITYFLIGGTLLGAVRHKGFIPWDDDLDIAMFRDDYEKFKNIAGDSLGENFCFIDLNDSKYYMSFGKVFKTDTKYCENTDDMTFNKGLWVDIFPIDKIDAKDLESAKDIANARRQRREDIITLLNYRKDGSKFSMKFKILAAFLGFISTDKLKKMLTTILTKDKDKDTLFCTNYGSQYGVNKQTMEYDLFVPVTEVEFENHKFNAPGQYDKILKHIYGDYMKLPPKEKRVSEHNLIMRSV